MLVHFRGVHLVKVIYCNLFKGMQKAEGGCAFYQNCCPLPKKDDRIDKILSSFSFAAKADTYAVFVLLHIVFLSVSATSKHHRELDKAFLPKCR